MLKQWVVSGFFTFFFVLTPVTAVFAEDNENGNGVALTEVAIIIIAIATLVLMIYYMIRD